MIHLLDREAVGFGDALFDQAIVMRRDGPERSAFLSTSAASSAVIGDFVSDANATTRISAPSSSRMFDGMTFAMNDEHVVGHRDLLGLCLLAQDGFARLEVGRLDVGEQAPFEPRAQPRLERLDLLGRPVARDDELLLRLVERVEGVEELFLSLFLALEKLDVVDQGARRRGDTYCGTRRSGCS